LKRLAAAVQAAVFAYVCETMGDMTKKTLSASSLGYGQADKRILILQLVGAHGSISQAARVAGVSYKAAWQALHTLTNLAGEALVDSSVGGAGGGGARLTPAGERLLHAATRLAQARQAVLSQLGAADDAIAAPRTSMRNHLRARVLELVGAGPREPMVRVRLALDGGAELAALITRESAELLGLAPGLALLALTKATAVRVVPAASGAPRPGVLPGRVLRVFRGTHGDEVTLTLTGGQQLVGFAERPNRLRAGSAALAQVDDRVVVLALPG